MNKANSSYIEQCFTKIKYKKDVNSSLLAISNTLRREYGKTFTIEIIKNKTNVFFGMNIYPSPSKLMDIAQRMSLNEHMSQEELTDWWNQIDSWCIEIDSLLFDDINMDIQADELTALLLHEIGHVVISDEVPKSCLKIFKVNFFKQDLGFRNIFYDGNIKRDVIGYVMSFPLIEACSNKSFFKRNFGKLKYNQALEREFYADKYVLKCGYGDALYNFIEKLIMYGQNDMVNKTCDEKANELTMVTNWSFDNINSLTMRRGKLYKALKVEMKRNPSTVVKTIATNLNHMIFKEPDGDFQNTNTLIIESFIINGLTKAANNVTRLLDKYNRVKPCKMRDLDIFEVEIANINTVDDKMYVIECIHDELDKADYALMLLEYGKNDRVTQSRSTIQAYKDSALKLLKQAKEAKIPEERYGLFIKYPKGYEG